MKSTAPILFLFALLQPLAITTAAGTAPTTVAFAGAEGFGRFASGGRGGEIVHVTTLADSGPGSLRDAVGKPNRIVVFDVGGVIRLKSNLAVSSTITLAGQTAPGEGVLIYGRSTSFSGRNNIIVRYLRFREGIQGDKRKCSVNLSSGGDMIFDHCSIEWGRWDCLGLTKGSHDMTFQNCIIGEGIDPQRFGSLSDDASNITYSHNLWINNQSRNPKAKGRIQYINNVVYNWGVCGLVGGHSKENHFLDAIGNYFIAGPNSNSACVGEFKNTDQVFQKDNFADLNKDGQLNGRPVMPEDFGRGGDAPTFMNAYTVSPQIDVKVDSAQDAVAGVIKDAGCSLHRDAVDARLIADLQSFGKSGKIIRNEAEAGGIGAWPEVHAVATYTDDTPKN